MKFSFYTFYDIVKWDEKILWIINKLQVLHPVLPLKLRVMSVLCAVTLTMLFLYYFISAFFHLQGGVLHKVYSWDRFLVDPDRRLNVLKTLINAAAQHCCIEYIGQCPNLTVHFGQSSWSNYLYLK